RPARRPAPGFARPRAARRHGRRAPPAAAHAFFFRPHPMNHPSENPTPETSQASAGAARRRWLLLGVGAVAGLGGAGLAAWRLRPGAVKEGAHEALWDASFE